MILGVSPDADANFALAYTLLPWALELLNLQSLGFTHHHAPGSCPWLFSNIYQFILHLFALAPLFPWCFVFWFWTTLPSSSCFWSLWCADLELPFWSWFFTQLTTTSTLLWFLDPSSSSYLALWSSVRKLSVLALAPGSLPIGSGMENMGGCVLVFVIDKGHRKKKAPFLTLSHQRFDFPAATSVTSFLRRQFGYLWYSEIRKVFQR